MAVVVAAAWLVLEESPEVTVPGVLVVDEESAVVDPGEPADVDWIDVAALSG